MSHPSHCHAHPHPDANASQTIRRLVLVLLLTGLYMAVEFIAGFWSNSLALIADAGHMLTDVGAIGLALFAAWFAKHPPSAQKTYGYYRLEIMAAFMNGLLLVLVSLYIFYEAYQRLGLNDLADSSLQTLKLNYPDNPSLKDGQFEPREDDDSSRSWLAKATLGLIDSNTAPPQMETQASKDVMRQYEDARQQIPRELQPEHQDEEVEKPDTSGKKSHSWWHYLTFGLVD